MTTRQKYNSRYRDYRIAAQYEDGDTQYILFSKESEAAEQSLRNRSKEFTGWTSESRMLKFWRLSKTDIPF